MPTAGADRAGRFDVAISCLPKQLPPSRRQHISDRPSRIPAIFLRGMGMTIHHLVLGGDRFVCDWLGGALLRVTPSED